jgi:hypothetical protein
MYPSGLTEPTALLIVTEVTLVVAQVNRVLCPRSIVVGLAVNESQLETGVGVATVTAAVQLFVPAVLVRLSVKVLLAVTVSLREPSAATFCPFNVTVVALDVFQARFTLPPPIGSDVGLAVNESQVGIGVGTSVTVTVTGQVTLLASRVAVRM